jgi:tetratricopeptide (TPR) repeat protein
MNHSSTVVVLAALAISLSATGARAAPTKAKEAATKAKETATKAKETAKKSVVLMAVPFTVVGDADAWVGFAAPEEITDLFAQEDNGAWVASKQIDAALRRKDLQLYDAADREVALPLARALGATDLIVGVVGGKEKTVTIKAQRWSVLQKLQVREAQVSGATERLPALLQELAVKLLDVSPKTLPMTLSAAALQQGTDCWRRLVRYPLQPRAGIPPPFDKAELAENHCRLAIKADPQFGQAHAGLAILKALRGDSAGAKAELAAGARQDRFEPWLPIAESFALRQGGEVAASRKPLEETLKEHPGYLLAAAYLAEDRLEAQDYKGALDAWDRFLKRAPSHPYALGQKGKVLGYLHRDAEAMALTRQALDVDPGDAELLVELGSRQLDAKKLPEAEASLRAAMEARPPRPLAWLRLGYVYLVQGRYKEAHEVLIEGTTYAYRDDEARTRGGFFVDLGLVAAMQSKDDEVIAYLSQAKAEGYGKLPCDAPQLASQHGKPAFDSLCKQ